MPTEDLDSRVDALKARLDSLKGVKDGDLAELYHLVEDLARQARADTLYDELTGLPNRRYLDAKLNEEFGRVQRYQTPLSLLMVDIDRFKMYNDAYGHFQGDEALKRVATALSSHRRPEDMVARYGGEEFLIVLPNTGQEGAIQVAEDLLSRVRSVEIPSTQTEGVPTDTYFENRGYNNVTVSIGVASSSDSPLHLLALDADRALYLAKEKGRDQYHSEGKESPYLEPAQILPFAVGSSGE